MQFVEELVIVVGDGLRLGFQHAADNLVRFYRVGQLSDGYRHLLAQFLLSLFHRFSLLIEGRGYVEDIVVVRHLVIGEDYTELALYAFLYLYGILVFIYNPYLAYHDREFILAVGFHQLASQSVHQQIIFHEVIIDVHHVVEHDVAAGQRSDTFFRYLVVLNVSWHQGIYRKGALAVAAGCLGDRRGKRVLAVVAGIYHGWSVIVNTDVAQFLVTLRTDEHTAHIVAAFRRYVGAAEVVDDVLKLQVRTSALRTALRIEQVRVVALRAEVLLEQEAVNAQ